MEGTFVQPLKDQPNAVQIYAIQAAALGKKKNRPGTGHEGPEVYSSTVSLNSALDGEWVVNVTLRLLYPRERPGTHCIGGWVGPRACLEV